MEARAEGSAKDGSGESSGESGNGTTDRPDIRHHAPWRALLLAAVTSILLARARSPPFHVRANNNNSNEQRERERELVCVCVCV